MHVENLNKLEADFRQKGIDFAQSGFYDHPRFVQAEQRDPSYIERYAEYVHARVYDEEYLVRARPIIERAAAFIHREVKADGRKGACIDASMVLSRMLERVGIWCCFVKGSVRVDFPDGSGLEPYHFWSLTHPANPAKTGHAWLMAPPFRIVDVTLDLQPWSAQQLRHVPGPVLLESPTPANYAPTDLMEPELLLELGRVPTLSEVRQMVRNFPERFGVFGVRVSGTGLTYIATGVSAPDAPLELMGNLVLRGKLPHQLYAEFITLHG